MLLLLILNCLGLYSLNILITPDSYALWSEVPASIILWLTVALNQFYIVYHVINNTVPYIIVRALKIYEHTQ